MFKMILRQTWKGFLNLSQAPATGKRNGQSYRTGFARACWAVGGLFIYFLIHYVLLNGSEDGSEDNDGIYLLLLGAAIAAGIGAFLAPRINAYLYQYTPQGRRNAKSKKQLSSRNTTISKNSKKSKNSSSSSQSSSSQSSSSSSASRSSKSTSN
ncbi:hypothetical protein [Polynucleobacter kasalickyi]|nr:hypothetical protein [Polynucleobacter kasalickyi]